jgi:hypothetical protein
MIAALYINKVHAEEAEDDDVSDNLEQKPALTYNDLEHLFEVGLP